MTQSILTLLVPIAAEFAEGTAVKVVPSVQRATTSVGAQTIVTAKAITWKHMLFIEKIRWINMVLAIFF